MRVPRRTCRHAQARRGLVPRPPMRRAPVEHGVRAPAGGEQNLRYAVTAGYRKWSGYVVLSPRQRNGARQVPEDRHRGRKSAHHRYGYVPVHAKSHRFVAEKCIFRGSMFRMFVRPATIAASDVLATACRRLRSRTAKHSGGFAQRHAVANGKDENRRIGEQE